MNPDQPSRPQNNAQEQTSGAQAGVNLPATVRCHKCGHEAKVPPQRIDLNAPTGLLQGYDQQGRHQGYLIDIECPNCGQLKRRLTADDA